MCQTSPSWSAGAPADPAADSILNVPAMRGGLTAYAVERIGPGAAHVYELNADLRLMPASNRKLFTTAAALGVLGPDYTITTPVLSIAQPDAQGTIDGDVYLRGAGDSLLSTADLDELARAMASHGVKKITGGVIGDGHVFEDGPYGTNWGWDTLNDDYAPAITGLEVNDGCVRILVTPGATAGIPAQYEVEPATRAQPVIDEAITTDSGGVSTLRARHPWRESAIVLTGDVPVGTHASIEIPVDDPVAYAADLFRSALLSAGISVEGDSSKGITPDRAVHILAQHASPPLRTYIASMNKPSDNLIAESLVRVIGKAKSGHGTYDAGDDAEMAYFKEIGLDTSDLTLDDGSGVSRRNYVTAEDIVKLLTLETQKPYFTDLRDSLPVAGVDGTLRHRLIGTKAAGNVRAKTGTLTGASALSGYFTGASGKTYAFSLIMNNYPGTATDVRKLQDEIVLHWVEAL